MNASMHQNPYRQLLVMVVLSFISMYVLMYAMVNVFANVFASFNQFYMAGLMTAPMVLIEVILMGKMYSNKTWNRMIIAGSVGALLVFWTLIRQQTGISDKQFLRSMIPHHAGAILMCEHASLTDPDIKKLCDGIITGQQREIDQMKTKLSQLEK